jgi:hypothetical protein
MFGAWFGDWKWFSRGNVCSVQCVYDIQRTMIKKPLRRSRRRPRAWPTHSCTLMRRVTRVAALGENRRDVVLGVVTSHCRVKHTSFTTETAQVADLPKWSDHPRSRGVDLSDQWRFSVNPKIHPPFSAKRRPAKRPPNLADRWLTLTLTAELSTFPAYWSVRLATQCQTCAVREKVRVGLRQYRHYIGKSFNFTVRYTH